MSKDEIENESAKCRSLNIVTGPFVDTTPKCSSEQRDALASAMMALDLDTLVAEAESFDSLLLTVSRGLSYDSGFNTWQYTGCYPCWTSRLMGIYLAVTGGTNACAGGRASSSCVAYVERKEEEFEKCIETAVLDDESTNASTPAVSGSQSITCVSLVSLASFLSLYLY
jgi:hypothetical protein